MYQEQKALFLYCVSPIHMGAGTAIGLIDNPIQRERHTEYPLFAGSGLKGAIRQHLAKSWEEELLDRIFGPENSEYAGAISFGDAQLVAFPVRCTKRAYVYATSPTALARTHRQLELLHTVPNWTIPEIQEGNCGIVQGSKLAEGNNNRLNLEVFQYSATENQELKKVAEWLANHALPQSNAYNFFRNKLKTDLVLLPDEDFTHFVKNATMVEPHVRINNETGTADSGGLFYTENLPPESLLLAPLMASVERKAYNKAMSAQEVVKKVLNGVDGQKCLNDLCLQIGGDATVGRGQIVISPVEVEEIKNADT